MSLWNAESVNPDTITPADIAEVAAEFNIDLDAAVPDDFFQPGQMYHRTGDTFRCAKVGMHDDYPVAIGYLPVNLAGEATWEFAAMTAYDWRHGWAKVEA